MKTKDYIIFLIIIYFLLIIPFFPIAIKHFDSYVREEMTANFLKYGDFRVENKEYINNAMYIHTPDGKHYPLYLPFPSLLAIPFYLLARDLLHIDPYYGLILLSHIIVILNIILFFLISRRLYSESVAFKLALIVISTPFLLYYERTFLIEPLILLCNLSLYYFYLKDKWTKTDLFLMSAVILSGILTRYVFLFSCVLFLFFLLWKKKLNRKKLIFLLFIIALGLGVVYYYKNYRFPPGSKYPYAYSFKYYLRYFPKYFFEGLLGMLFSPGKGLFILHPLLLFSLVFLLKSLQKYLFPLTLFLSYYLFYSGWVSWEGSMCFGPRFLVCVYLFLLFPLGEFFSWKNKSKIIVGIFLLTYFLSVWVNIASLWYNDIIYYSSLINLINRKFPQDQKIPTDLYYKNFYDVLVMTTWEWKFTPYLYFQLPSWGIPRAAGFPITWLRRNWNKILFLDVVGIVVIVYFLKRKNLLVAK